MKKLQYNIILGSKSPRRKELLEGLNIPFEIKTFETDEVYPETIAIDSIPVYLAKLKSKPFLPSISKDEIVITSDTIVVLGEKVLGKPKDKLEAISMLQELSGKTHQVITGVALTTVDSQDFISVKTEVTFEDISIEEITNYVESFRPFDKAGSYGIQEWIGYAKVKSIKGCYYNVIGLPLSALYQLLIDKKIID